MKFGKRFSQAQGEYHGDYLCYKAVKQALKHDCLSQDALGSKFEQVLGEEMEKVSAFYKREESRLKSVLQHVEALTELKRADALQELYRHIQDLTKFAALNYVAVLKAVKKRNRRLRDACGDMVVTVSPLSILHDQAFFSSQELAELSSATAKLEPAIEAETKEDKAKKAYSCPICRHLLQAPVRLTCTHAFCWGCITMYCLGVLQSKSDAPPRTAAIPARMSQLLQGWAPTSERDTGVQQFACPVCQQQQRLELDHLNVDQNLAQFVDKHSMTRARAAISNELQVATAATSAVSTASELPTTPPSSANFTARSESSEVESSATATAVSAPPLTPPPPPAEPASMAPESSASDTEAVHEALLPPQQPQWRGKLSIVLDIDGTLVASFPPRRAPRLPASMRTHLVGTGSSLNPQGVFVVERPGLQEFLQRISELGELSIFTAGLPEYAMPILHAIDPSGAFFGDRVVCRGGTSAAPEYPCVKDLSRLGRDLARTLIIDDTPLAFLWQAANGVPVLGFRGLPDDNLLLGAVLPLLQLASREADVRPFLDARFGMAAWFTRQGYVTHKVDGAEHPAASPSVTSDVAVASAEAVAGIASALEQRTKLRALKGKVLLLCDFDKTLVDFDVTERVTEEVAIELKPFLQNHESPADFVTVMNAVLREMSMRGVQLDSVLAALRGLGGEVAGEVAAVLRAAHDRGHACCILSNCNDLFINQVLEGAGIADVFADVITHSASVSHGSTDPAAEACGPQAAGTNNSHSWGMTIGACQSGTTEHNCKLCPPTLCKGMWVNALKEKHPRIVFCCDGANDLCPLLCLREIDVALVCKGFACHRLMEERSNHGGTSPCCDVVLWSTQAELAACIRKQCSL